MVCCLFVASVIGVRAKAISVKNYKLLFCMDVIKSIFNAVIYLTTLLSCISSLIFLLYLITID